MDKVSLMIRDFRTLDGTNPVGTNAEIMKAVMGGNFKRAMLGPPEGQNLNANGELVDRWGLENNFMWANDYPHHEGSWPHSAAAIERTMGHLNDKQRARILGLNAADLFGFDVPAEYKAKFA